MHRKREERGHRFETCPYSSKQEKEHACLTMAS
jgi:hypothetical protein